MQAAIAHREEIIPEFLREFEAIAADGQNIARSRESTLLTAAVYLLAQFRETRAFKPLVRMISLPEEIPFDLLGDTIHEGLDRLLGTLYDGDLQSLERLIESDETNDYVRSAALDSFIVLERSGQMPRETVVDYYRKLFRGRLKREFSHVWNGLVSSCVDLPAPELLEEIREAYKDELVEWGFGGLKETELELQQLPDELRMQQENKFALITDAISEMEWWACFHTEPRRKIKIPNLPKTNWIPRHNPSSPGAKRESPKISRNDPCPCGSGQKYKKCCLGKS
ncbi:MAG: hypothetical protein JWM99_1695 [Verrucomicrobiales bacterium]|nr:hypothetical protein [Verrucomicrobiales bacterium]